MRRIARSRAAGLGLFIGLAFAAPARADAGIPMLPEMGAGLALAAADARGWRQGSRSARKKLPSTYATACATSDGVRSTCP